MPIFYFSASNIVVLAGNIDRTSQRNWIRSTVSEVFIHEEYKPEDPRGQQFPLNDIAVIRVSKYRVYTKEWCSFNS
jgi:hypothetical protein